MAPDRPGWQGYGAKHASRGGRHAPASDCRSSPSCLALVGALVGLAGPSNAGPPGKWTVISGGGVTNIVQPGLYRTADGTLHVAMHRDATDFTVEYIDVAHITESGKLTGRYGRHRPLGGSHDRPRAGRLARRRHAHGVRRHPLRPTPTTRTVAGYLWQTSSPADGPSWTLQPTAAVTANTGYASSGSGATTLDDGTLVAAYPAGTHHLLPGRSRSATGLRRRRLLCLPRHVGGGRRRRVRRVVRQRGR